MAVVGAIYQNHSQIGDYLNDGVLPMWTLAAGDVGAPVKMGAFSDRTVHFAGTFSGASIELRGSNYTNPDPENASDWFALTDPKMTTPLSGITSNSGFVLYENPLFVSPKITGGDGSTSLNISILGRKKQ